MCDAWDGLSWDSQPECLDAAFLSGLHCSQNEVCFWRGATLRGSSQPEPAARLAASGPNAGLVTAAGPPSGGLTAGVPGTGGPPAGGLVAVICSTSGSLCQVRRVSFCAVRFLKS